jgi:chorismate mutase
VRAIRGATTLDADTPDQVRERVLALVSEVFERNDLAVDDVISLVVTATDDIRSAHPATAARAWGLADVPILGARELHIDGGLGLCVRFLLHVETAKARAELQHVFLQGAVVLRPDLVRDDTVRDDTVRDDTVRDDTVRDDTVRPDPADAAR